MKQKLEDSSYKTKEEFLADLQLIFDNAKIFYKKKSKNYKFAEELEEFVKPLIENLEEKQEQSKEEPESSN